MTVRLRGFLTGSSELDSFDVSLTASEGADSGAVSFSALSSDPFSSEEALTESPSCSCAGAFPWDSADSVSYTHLTLPTIA